MNTAHVLLVDDDHVLLELMSEFLRGNGLVPFVAASTAIAEQLLQQQTIDVMVLDVRLPGESGFAFLARLRQQRTLPVIFLSGEARTQDRIRGLDVGADDYLVKPFEPDELLARIRALLRRQPFASECRFGPFRFSRHGLQLFIGDNEVVLKSHQRALLKAFAEHPGQVLTRERLLALLGDIHGERYDRSIDVRVTRLRDVLSKHASGHDYIVTVRGQGYRFSP